MHALLAAAPSLRRLDSTAREQLAERCLAAHAVTGILPPAAMVAATDRFLDWVDHRYPGATWHTEVPVTAPRSQGGRWQGFIDLLLRLPDGAVVLVDHKSAPIRRDMCPAKAREYTGQLAAYREQLAAHGEQIRDTWIHFPLAAALVRM